MDDGAELACWREVWKIKILQINLQLSKEDSGDLLLRVEREEAGIVLIKEPWLSSYEIFGIRTKSHKLLAASLQVRIEESHENLLRQCESLC